MAYRPIQTFQGRPESQQPQQQQYGFSRNPPPNGFRLPPPTTNSTGPLRHPPPPAHYDPYAQPGYSSYAPHGAERAGWQRHPHQQQQASYPQHTPPYLPLPAGAWGGSSSRPGGYPLHLPPTTLARGPSHPSQQQQQQQQQQRSYASSASHDSHRDGPPPSTHDRGDYYSSRPHHYHHQPPHHQQPFFQNQRDGRYAERDSRHPGPDSRRRSCSPELHVPRHVNDHGGGGGRQHRSHATSGRPERSGGRMEEVIDWKWSRAASSSGVAYPPPPPQPQPKRRMKPRESYLATSLSTPSRLPSPSDPTTAPGKKLILLDLNGSLVFRANKQQADSYRLRPFVSNFIAYLRKTYEVGVWSSAQPHSVGKMVGCIGLRVEVDDAAAVAGGGAGQQGQESAAGGQATTDVKLVPEDARAPRMQARADADAEALVLKVLWARDTFGLSAAEYNQKVDTIKDLDRIWQHLNSPPASASPRPAAYDALNTLLLDDSYSKTACQPFNHLPVPDFNQAIATSSARAYRAALAFAQVSGRLEEMEPELRVDWERCVIDRSLLGIIGILERARGEANVAAWIRAGGLVPDLEDPDGWWTKEDDPTGGGGVEEGGHEGRTADRPPPATKRLKKSKQRKTLGLDALHMLVFPPPPSSPSSSSPSISAPPHPTPAELSPTAQPPVPWYASPPHADFWTRQGLAALEALGIALDFAMAVDFLPATRAEIEVSRAEKAERDARRREEQERQQAGEPNEAMAAVVAQV